MAGTIQIPQLMENVMIDNDYIEIWMEDGIIFSSYKPNLVINLEIAKLMVKERLKVTNGIERPLFIDISNLISVDLEAREYLSGGDAIKFIKAGAIYTKNPIAKFAGKLFVDVNQPQATTKIFTNKDEAIEWLQQFKK